MLTLMTGTDSIRILEFLVHPRSSVPTDRERREIMWSRSQRVLSGRRPRSALSFCPAPIPSCLSLSSTSPHVVHRGSGSTRTIHVHVRLHRRHQIPSRRYTGTPPATGSSLSCVLFLFTRAHNAPPMPDLITGEPTPAFFSQQSPRLPLARFISHPTHLAPPLPYSIAGVHAPLSLAGLIWARFIPAPIFEFMRALTLILTTGI
ncbi:hypothetical protein B0H13DRAFT_2484803 [Mycena leptocephala]|nr:hypothetical protein B0H13DRAFT_2484803 [Mycena leptocephala]